MDVKLLITWVMALIALAFVLQFDDNAQAKCEEKHSANTCHHLLRQ